MSKLEERMLKQVKNKKTRVNSGMKIVNVVSISYLFMTPMLAMFFVCKYFVKNQDLFLTLMTLSFFCGVYNAYRELSKFYSQKVELEKNSEGKNEYF